MSDFTCRQCGSENTSWKEDWIHCSKLVEKLKRIALVLAEWPCPVCQKTLGKHDVTCALGKALDS